MTSIPALGAQRHQRQIEKPALHRQNHTFQPPLLPRVTSAKQASLGENTGRSRDSTDKNGLGSRYNPIRLSSDAAPQRLSPSAFQQTACRDSRDIRAVPTVRSAKVGVTGKEAYVKEAATLQQGHQGSAQTYEDSQAPSPLPLPVRPGSFLPPQATLGLANSYNGVAATASVAQAKPYVLEVPPFVPMLSNNKRVDFFPWSGDHPEDVLSIDVIKNGFFSKPTLSGESQTARQSIGPLLKHKNGLQALSSLLVEVLEQRQCYGRVTTPSTFKPPPRVTLTDTKREAWLRDLATHSVPLRRLSRTIPHGIRGRILLEQCLNKKIPIVRSVWLAKCVGANEIRAFKRKGAGSALGLGGESKWIKEWTGHVQQFVENIINACGENSWRDHITYAIRLSSCFYSERLLDTDQYLEWLLTSLAAASLDKFPAWLLLLQIHWKDIIQYRKYGRYLTETLLETLYLIKADAEEDVYQPVSSQIARLLKTIPLQQEQNLVIPGRWMRFRPIISSLLFSEVGPAASRFAKLDQRNQELNPSGRLQKRRNSPKKIIIQMLDSVSFHFHPSLLSSRCLEIVNDYEQLVKILLEWVTSPYRLGIERVYLSVRLLRKWKRSGVNIDNPILQFLSQVSPSVSSASNIYLLVSELIRSQSFSFGGYLQWLIAGGILSGHSSLKKEDSCDIHLLTEVPLYGLQPHLLNLRRVLLSTLGFPTAKESAAVEEAKALVSLLIPNFKDDELLPDAEQGSNPDVDLAVLSRQSLAIKAETSRWIRERTALRKSSTELSTSTEHKRDDPSQIVSAITIRQFQVIRWILEELEDFSILADIIKIVSTSKSPAVLSGAIDTLGSHLGIFDAIGALTDCYVAILQRHRSLKARDELLLLSLIDLGSRINRPGDELSSLKADLRKCRQNSTASVYSPVSDHMADYAQSADSELSEEIERALASGTTMGRASLAHWFEAIVSRLESMDKETGTQTLNLALVLSRLSAFDPRGFFSLISAWLNKLLLLEHRLSLSKILSPLVGANCIDLDLICSRVASTLNAKDGAPSPERQATIAIETLELIVGNQEQGTPVLDRDEYRLRLSRSRIMTERPQCLLFLACKSIAHLAQTEARSTAKLEAILSDRSLIQSLQRVVAFEIDELKDLFALLSPKASLESSSLAKNLIDRILYTPDISTSTTDTSLQVTMIVKHLNELSIEFCRSRIAAIISGLPGSKEIGEREALIYALVHAVDTAADPACELWPNLLSTLDSTMANQVCKLAEENFFALASYENLDQVMGTNHELLDRSNRHLAQKYLTIVEATTICNVKTGIGDKAHHLVDHLARLTDSIAPLNEVRKQLPIGSELPSALRYEETHEWLRLFLKLLVIKGESFWGNKTGQADHGRVMLSLCSLILNDSIQANPELHQYCFDIAAISFDGLSEDTRAQCMRSLKGHSHNLQLRYLFGFIDGPSDWLCISQRGKLAPFALRPWETLSEPTPNVGENDTSLNLTLFQARKA